MVPEALHYDFSLKCPICSHTFTIKNSQYTKNITTKCPECQNFFCIEGRKIITYVECIELTKTIQKLLEVKKMTEYEMKKSVIIEDGAYKGRIEREEQREIDYKGKKIKYQDFYISVDGVFLDSEKKERFELKTGFSAYMSDASELGRFVKKFFNVEIGEKIDLAKLLGKNVSFLVNNVERSGGKYAEIMKETIKPL